MNYRSRGFSLAPTILIACSAPTPIMVEGGEGESSTVADLPEDETGDDTTDEPPIPGEQLPPYVPSCEFIEMPVAFAAVDSEPEDNQGNLEMSACGHVSTRTRLFYPDGTATESSGRVDFAPTGELGLVILEDTVELFDLVTRTRRTVAREQHGFVASFADGVASRVWTCAAGRLEAHDGAQTWLLDEGLTTCGSIEAAEGAPIITYRHGEHTRVVNSDTGVVTTLALDDDPPKSDCERTLTMGYDGDAIAQTWRCEDLFSGEVEPFETSLVSTQTGLQVGPEQPDVSARQLSTRGGAWWFYTSAGELDHSVFVLVDGQLQPLIENYHDHFISPDGTVYTTDRDDTEPGLRTLLRSDDRGHAFVSLGSRPNIQRWIRANWEGTAVSMETVVNGEFAGIDLWADGTWPWPEALQGAGLQSGPLFADGALIFHDDDDVQPYTQLRSPAGEILGQWERARRALRLDARVVMGWGDAYPFIPGGLALIESDGSTSPLVPLTDPSAAWSVEVAPLVGMVAAWMTDGNQRVLWYGRPES